MGESYRAIYAATLSRIGSADAGAAIRDAANRAFDISHARRRGQARWGWE
jgi:hypothetical protein